MLMTKRSSTVSSPSNISNIYITKDNHNIKQHNQTLENHNLTLENLNFNSFMFVFGRRYFTANDHPQFTWHTKLSAVPTLQWE